MTRQAPGEGSTLGRKCKVLMRDGNSKKRATVHVLSFTVFTLASARLMGLAMRFFALLLHGKVMWAAQTRAVQNACMKNPKLLGEEALRQPVR